MNMENLDSNPFKDLLVYLKLFLYTGLNLGQQYLT
jgi:hypothetical protein